MIKTVIILLAALALSQQAAVDVGVYYESLCPDSIRFIRNQLYPTWQLLGEQYMTVDWVPYGKATHVQDADGVWTYTCQHGPDECAGNRAQACALDQFGGNQTKNIEFVHCAMTALYPPTAGPTCAQDIPQDYAPIQACIDGDRGDTLIVAYGDRTHGFEPTITFVPTISFDGAYTVADQDGALTDLLSVVCDKLQDPKPSACAGKTRRH